MKLKIRDYESEDFDQLIRITNETIEAGQVFQRMDNLTADNVKEFFASYQICRVAEINGVIFGFYLLKTRGEGRSLCSGTVKYVVAYASRGLGLGHELVSDSVRVARKQGYSVLVAEDVLVYNDPAIAFLETTGFQLAGTLPKSFLNGIGGFEDTRIYYKLCNE